MMSDADTLRTPLSKYPFIFLAFESRVWLILHRGTHVLRACSGSKFSFPTYHALLVRVTAQEDQTRQGSLLTVRKTAAIDPESTYKPCHGRLHEDPSILSPCLRAI